MECMWRGLEWGIPEAVAELRSESSQSGGPWGREEAGSSNITKNFLEAGTTS